MKDTRPKATEPPDPIVDEAVERLLGDPTAAAQSPAGVALAAVEVARAKGLPNVLWALSGHPTREVGKAARRALHLLRSRGVAVGERPEAPRSKVALSPPQPGDEASEPCRTTTADGFGDRALWIPLKRLQGFELWELVLSDELGVREVHRAELSRKQLRAHFASLPKGGMGIYVLPRPRAAGLLAEAIALGGAPRELTEARGLLDRLGGGNPATAVPDSAVVGAPGDDPERLAESAQLFDEPELRTFVPPEQLLRELALKLDEIEVSPLLLDGRQKADRRQHVLDQAVESHFTPVRRARYARRLFELCDLWTAEEKPMPAARAAAVARHLVGAAPILEDPFARRMFQRIFAKPPAATQGSETPEPEKPVSGGLIVPG
jgi:hypothetical protein